MIAIDEKYAKLGGANGPLKQVIQREYAAGDGVGRLCRYKNGVIVWHPQNGVHAILGAIAEKWFELGSENGFLGYPVSEELSAPGGHYYRFQRGNIYQIGSEVKVIDLTADVRELDYVMFKAQPQPWDLSAQIPTGELAPPVLDYSSDINFTRNQQPGGGCMSFALLHIVDILKDWEHPYTPALSFRYIDWFRRKNIGDPNWELWTPFEHGVAPEGLCHTDFDNEFDPAKESAGLMPWNEPSTEAHDAAFYHITMKVYQLKQPTDGQSMSPSVEEIKHLLRRYGPVWISGNGHATAIVGYDDIQRRFKVLDSYVDMNGNGENVFHLSPYNDIHNHVGVFCKVVNVPTPQRVTSHHAYSARIRIENCWRGTYTVSVGVEGREPLVVWTTRGREADLPWEPSRVLAIDVPLPDYAEVCWPPSASHRWFLRVEDHDRDGGVGTITEFTLVRRYIYQGCETIGRYRSETYGGLQNVVVPDPTSGTQAPSYGNAPSPTPNPNPGITTVHIPEDGAITISAQQKYFEAFTITLQDQGTIQSSASGPAQEILVGQLKKYSNGTWNPVPIKQVSLYGLDQVACINKPSQWNPIANAMTGDDGTFAFMVPAPAPITNVILLGKRFYTVAYSKEPGNVLASSKAVTVNLSDTKELSGKLVNLSDYDYEEIGDEETYHPEW